MSGRGGGINITGGSVSVGGDMNAGNLSVGGAFFRLTVRGIGSVDFVFDNAYTRRELMELISELRAGRRIMDMNDLQHFASVLEMRLDLQRHFSTPKFELEF